MMSEAPPSTPATAASRIERKYPLCVIMLEAAIRELRRICPLQRYSDSTDWSSIRTTYLDTPDLTCYQEYLQNYPVRRKIRIRQYGVGGRFGDTCWVELKVKKERLSVKRRFSCTLEDADRFIRGEDIFGRLGLEEKSDASRAYQLIRNAVLEQRLLPVIRVDYERVSFQKPGHHGVRLTLDREMRFCSASREHRGELEGLVLEVKHSGESPAWLPVLRERLGMKRIRHYSKFGRSIGRLIELREEACRP